jgi:hypothetical protein
VRGIVPGGGGGDPGPPVVRGRVAMVVRNAVAGDSRVRKSASALAAARWDVTVIGTSPDAGEHRLELDGVPVRLVPVPPLLTTGRAAVQRAAWRELARRDAALRGHGGLRVGVGPLVPGRPGWLVRTVAGAATPHGGWRRLDPWVQEVELALAPVVEALDPDVIHAHDHHTAPLAARSAAVLCRRGREVRWVPRRERAARPAAPADDRRDARGARPHRRRRRHGLR